MWLIFERKTYGEKGANIEAKWSGTEQSDNICHLGLYFYCCGRMIGWEGTGDNTPTVQFRGIFGISLPKG